ncbi:MAG: hypothetical protein FJ033_04830 [Chloroflexi bacterium]|nr:hypothetical protein [Chloroflexota bacterium]
MGEEPDPIRLLDDIGVASRSLQAVTGGADTLIWRVVTESGRTLALRLYRASQSAAAERVLAAHRDAREGGLPVPEVVHAGIWKERPYLATAWVDGTTMMDQLGTAPWRAWEYGRAVGTLQAKAHRIAPRHLAVEGHWWGRVTDRLPPAIERAINGSTDRALLHLNLHPGNLVMAEQRIVGIIGWTNVRVGPRALDLARTESLLLFYPIPVRTFAFSLLRAVLAAGWRAGYHASAGALPGLAPFRVWAARLMLDEVERRLAQEGTWLQDSDLLPVDAWFTRWRHEVVARG